MQFVDVTNDIAFRKIFGNESKKFILLSFLNAVLGLKGENRLTEVEILNPYQLPIVQNKKATIIDLRAKDGLKRSFIIEMQVTEPRGMDKRLLYYTSKEYAGQLLIGDQYTLLKPVIFIGIFDFPFTQGDKAFSHHALCDLETGERVIKDMDLFFIELPKFNKTLDQLETIIEKWIFFLKEAENLNVIPTNADDEGLLEAYHDANRQTWTQQEWDAYIDAGVKVQDERGAIELAVERAVEQAEKTKERKTREEIALRLLEMGLSLEQVSNGSGLSIEEVNLLMKTR